MATEKRNSETLVKSFRSVAIIGLIYFISNLVLTPPSKYKKLKLTQLQIAGIEKHNWEHARFFARNLKEHTSTTVQEKKELDKLIEDTPEDIRHTH